VLLRNRYPRLFVVGASTDQGLVSLATRADQPVTRMG
jgi:hypothetical protein